MRVLMWFTIGFAAACALSIYLGAGVWLCLFAIAGAALLFVQKKPAANAAAVIAIGLAVGILWTTTYQYGYLNAVKKHDGKKFMMVATVTDFSYDTSYGVAADARTEIEGETYRLRIYYPHKVPLLPGDRIIGEFRIRLTTDDSLQGGTHHQGNGIFLLVYADKESAVVRGYHEPADFFGAHVRRKISQLIQDAFPEDTLGLANALLLGDSSLLDYETDTDFKVSGIRHIIAVSGLHVSIIMSAVYLFSARRRYLSALIGIPVLFLFACIVGFTPSVVRACIMQGLILLALFFNKEYDPPTALAFAVLTMLCINPMVIISVSFQLSCGCIVGIFLFYERTNRYLLRLFKIQKDKTLKTQIIRWFSGSVSITLSTTVATMPLCAAYFGAISIVGVLTNLLTLWVVSFIFCGIILACTLGFVWMPLAEAVAWGISLPMRYVLFTAKNLAALPFSAVYTDSVYIVLWLVLCYALFAQLLIAKRKHPLLFLGCVAAGLVISISLSWLEPSGKNYRITVFDVGQGQSILIECDQKRFLVDCGGDSERVAADTVSHHLLSRGITRLDGVIATHYDVDHAGGIPLLLTQIRSDMLYLPDVEDNGTVRDMLAAGESSVYWIDRCTVLDFGKLRFTLFPGDRGNSENETSMCILFQTENCDILITGDRSEAGEKALLETVTLPELELLVVGHHGSSNSTGLELLTATKPKNAAISVGKGNYYGHPTRDVLYRLELFGCKIWRTDQSGTVVFRG